MLPTPATYYEKRGISSRAQRKTRDVLLARARVTNLGLLLLTSFCAFSFLFNLGFYLSSGSVVYSWSQEIPPQSILVTIERDQKLKFLDHLVIVPGHAIWKGNDPSQALDENSWILEDYQKGGGRVTAFYNHIQHAYVHILALVEIEIDYGLSQRRYYFKR